MIILLRHKEDTMKKVLSIIVIFVLLFSLAGCGSEDEVAIEESASEEATDVEEVEEETDIDLDGEAEEANLEKADESERPASDENQEGTGGLGEGEEPPEGEAPDRPRPEDSQEAAETESLATEETSEVISETVDSSYLDILQTPIDSGIITESEAVALTAFIESNVPGSGEGMPEGGRPEGGPPGEEGEDGEMSEGGPPAGEDADGQRPEGGPQDGEMVSIFMLAAEEGIITTDQAEALDASVELPQPEM